MFSVFGLSRCVVSWMCVKVYLTLAKALSGLWAFAEMVKAVAKQMVRVSFMSFVFKVIYLIFVNLRNIRNKKSALTFFNEEKMEE